MIHFSLRTLILVVSYMTMAMFFSVMSHAQITGGQYVFQSLSMSPSARITALGGAQITVKDDDISFALANPAALNPSMNGRVTFNHNFFLSDLQYGYFGGGKYLKKVGMTIHGGLRYLKYGDIKHADEYGNLSGEIKAGETALTIGGSRALSHKISLGLNFHFMNATLDTYRSSALAADAAVMYVDSASRFTAALVLKNKGVQMSTFADNREDLPFDIQLGVSKRLRHLPFRVGIIAHHLQQWDIRYDDPNAQDEGTLLFGDASTSKKGNPGIDNLFRHFIFNGEFLLGRNEAFRIRVGYNHLRKKELSVNSYRSLAGFSGGVGLKVNRFRVDVGYAAYHLAGSAVHFSIGTNLNEFFH